MLTVSDLWHANLPFADVLKNFAVLTGRTPVLESLFNKVAGLQACKFIKKKTPTLTFFCEYCEILKRNFFWCLNL